VRDPLVPACYFDIDWLGTGHREHYDPTDPQLVVAIMPGRWINDSGAVATADRVCVALADGPNALQLDRGSGAIVADVQFNADSLPLWLVETDADHRRIVSVMDLRGVAGLPAGA
ncbi:MAG TPA: hypothetical protein VI172_15715, partial [Candidatus Dormibacteraeota bacterium]|jgi:hypothetical protein